jgi:hypothetical protein
MELNIQKKIIIYFTYKIKSIHFNYYVSGVLILRSDCIKHLGVMLDIMLDIKLYLHCHVYFVYSQALRILGCIRFITYDFPSLDSLVVLYNALTRSKLEYASVIWNNLTSTDSNNIENKQRKFASLSYYRFLHFT